MVNDVFKIYDILFYLCISDVLIIMFFSDLCVFVLYSPCTFCDGFSIHVFLYT
jgi:hypothetical protein